MYYIGTLLISVHNIFSAKKEKKHGSGGEKYFGGEGRAKYHKVSKFVLLLRNFFTSYKIANISAHE